MRLSEWSTRPPHKGAKYDRVLDLKRLQYIRITSTSNSEDGSFRQKQNTGKLIPLPRLHIQFVIIIIIVIVFFVHAKCTHHRRRQSTPKGLSTWLHTQSCDMMMITDPHFTVSPAHQSINPQSAVRWLQ